MAMFPGFSPAGCNGDVGMTDADNDEEPSSTDTNSAISRTADHFGTALRISPPRLSIPNPLRNYFAISQALDPNFSPTPALVSSDTTMASSVPPAVLPMTPIYLCTPESSSAFPQLPAQPSMPPPQPPQFDTPRPKPAARNKVPLEKGYSQMVWLRLVQSETDLAGLKGESPRRLLTMDEIKKHKNEDEAWTILRGRVYNVTPYLKFHPGGVDMLMKAAGKDGTALFNKYHAWVNAEFLLEKCLVGILDQS